MRPLPTSRTLFDERSLALVPEIRQASFDINPDGRIVWVEIEGVPLKLWTLNTFKRIVTRWGNLIDTNDSDGNCFHSKRLCLFTKSISNIYENFKIIFRGKVYWIRAKEVPGWTPDLVEDSDEEELSDDDSLEEGMKNLESENDCSNSFEVPDTVFENEGGSKKDSSVDPFGLYPLLNKKTKDQKHKESGTNSSPKFPPGFTPNNDNDDTGGTGDKKSVNDFEEEKLNKDDGDSNNSNLKENVDESASFGRFKKSVAPSSGGSFMCLMEEVVKVGQTMGYNMDGVINNLSDIIESQGASIIALIDKGTGTEVEAGKRMGGELAASRANIDMRFPKTISEDQSQDLEREVSKQEIKTAVWGCGTDKSPGPDGFSFGFYRHFWPVIEHDVYMAVNHFFIHGEIPPGCNSSFIALIPKLVNVLGDIVNEVQSAFIAERQMLDGPFILNEILQWCTKKKKKTLIFKVIQAAAKLGCLVLKCPFYYLGTRVGGSMTRVQAWQEIVEKVEEHLGFQMEIQT
ncbi:hypothetical protein Tco_0760989 [Tanacetum coccineum]